MDELSPLVSPQNAHTQETEGIAICAVPSIFILLILMAYYTSSAKAKLYLTIQIPSVLD